MYHFFSNYNNEAIINNWASNQPIRMISEGSCDTEDWSTDAENSALPSQEFTFKIYSNQKIVFFM